MDRTVQSLIWGVMTGGGSRLETPGKEVDIRGPLNFAIHKIYIRTLLIEGSKLWRVNAGNHTYWSA